MKKLIALCVLAASVAAVKAADEGSFFQASLTPEIAIKAKTERINGICLSIWGENPQSAFAFGFVNGSTGDSKGFSLSFFYNYADSYTGVAWALVNYSKVEFTGWQWAVVNVSQGKFTGFQSGFVNVSQEFHGLQFGLVNYTENLHGVQIGFANIAMNNPWFKEFPDKLATGFPFFNWSF
jgi:hypothetical protein